MSITKNHSESPLEALIHQQVVKAEGIPFSEFMGLCLYHPQYGYYMAPRQRIGKGGDFFTSSSVHCLFGRLLARQLAEMWEILGCGEFVVVEQGAGEGHLCLDILDAVARDYPLFYSKLKYLLVEISPDNRSRQAKMVSRHAQCVEWSRFEDLAEISGCFLSNELVDAFPVHLVEMRSAELLEVFVVSDGAGGLREELRPLSSPEILPYFSRLGVFPVEGTRVEVNLHATRWLQEVGRLLERGFVLTIDYGYPAAELYAPWRKNGTLLCYHRHSSNDDPYQRMGDQDITAHVDFTSLQRAGEDVQLDSLYFGEQYRFLMGLGFVDDLIELQASEPDEKKRQALRLTLKNLILPDGGMGETFKVLIQGKGVGSVALRCSRRLKDLPLPVL